MEDEPPFDYKSICREDNDNKIGEDMNKNMLNGEKKENLEN